MAHRAIVAFACYANVSTMSSRMKAVCLLSGGLDSSTCLGVARREGFECYALSFDYGQRHRIELEAAARVARHFRCARASRRPHRSAGFRRQRADRRYRRAQRQLCAQWRRAFRSPTFRRATRFFFPMRWLGPRCWSASDIFIGVNAIDYSGYPDCRPEFITAFETHGESGHQSRRRGPDAYLRIHTPLMAAQQGGYREAGSRRWASISR